MQQCVTRAQECEAEHRKTEEEIQRSYDIQAVLNTLLHLSLENIPLEEILDRTLELVLAIPWLALEVKGAISLVEDDPAVLVMKSRNNLEGPIIRVCARVPFGKCFCGRAALSQKIEFSNRFDERHETCYEGMLPHGHYCTPIVYGGKTLGVIVLYIREGHPHNRKEEEFLTSIADTLAGIIERKRTNEKLEGTLEDLRKAMGATIHLIANIAEMRDAYTAGHQRKVADLARTIATDMGLSSDRVNGLRMAGTVHDIGKVSIPAEILSKPQRLTEIEFSLIKTHAQAGYDILKDMEFPWPIADIVLQHHERMDPDTRRGSRGIKSSLRHVSLPLPMWWRPWHPTAPTDRPPE